VLSRVATSTDSACWSSYRHPRYYHHHHHHHHHHSLTLHHTTVYTTFPHSHYTTQHHTWPQHTTTHHCTPPHTGGVEAYPQQWRLLPQSSRYSTDEDPQGLLSLRAPLLRHTSHHVSSDKIVRGRTCLRRRSKCLLCLCLALCLPFLHMAHCTVPNTVPYHIVPWRAMLCLTESSSNYF
jgi:hypothetical protein